MTITNERTGEKITPSRTVIQDLKLTFTCEMNDAINHERWATARRSASWIDACETALQDYADTASWCDYVNRREHEIEKINKEREVENEIEVLKNKYEKAILSESQIASLWYNKLVEYSECVGTATVNENLDAYKVVFTNGSEIMVYTPKSGTKEAHKAKLMEITDEKISYEMFETIIKDPMVSSVRPLFSGQKEIVLEDDTCFRVKVI